MASPKVAMRVELEAKFKRKYDEKLKQMQAEYEASLEEIKASYLRRLDMALQMSADGAMMAIDDVFDVNEYSASKFHTAHEDYVNGIAKLCVEDSKTDDDIVYTKTDVDRRLLQIVGKDNFVPWNGRYTGCRIIKG